MSSARNTAFTVATLFAVAAGVCCGKTLASVGGEAITDADVVAAAGYMPKGEKLREVVGGLVERKIILALAESKALAASADEVSRAATLSARAFPPAGNVGGAAYRRYLAEEIVISKYVDLYVYPQIKADEENLTAYFLEKPGLFMKRPPRDRAALKKMFPKYRNEVLYRYVRAEIARLLRKSGNEGRAALSVEIYL